VQTSVVFWQRTGERLPVYDRSGKLVAFVQQQGRIGLAIGEVPEGSLRVGQTLRVERFSEGHVELAIVDDGGG
jgi:hypothetical protein